MTGEKRREGNIIPQDNKRAAARAGGEGTKPDKQDKYLLEIPFFFKKKFREGTNKGHFLQVLKTVNTLSV